MCHIDDVSGNVSPAILTDSPVEFIESGCMTEVAGTGQLRDN